MQLPVRQGNTKFKRERKDASEASSPICLLGAKVHVKLTELSNIFPRKESYILMLQDRCSYQRRLLNPSEKEQPFKYASQKGICYEDESKKIRRNLLNQSKYYCKPALTSRWFQESCEQDIWLACFHHSLALKKTIYKPMYIVIMASRHL